MSTTTAVKVGGSILTADTDYTLTGNTLTIKKEYLATKVVGPVAVSIEFSAGIAATFIINVIDTPWIDPIISSVNFSSIFGSNPITAGKFTGWNSGSQYGLIELSFAQPQTFSKVKVTAYAQPDSTESYILYNESGQIIGRTTQMVIGESTFEIPVTNGTYSKLRVEVWVGEGRSWVNIVKVLLGE